MSVEQKTIEDIRRLHKEGKTFAQIAEQLSVSWPTARRYALGKNGAAPPRTQGAAREEGRRL